jgi:hypothetical protein
MFNWELRINYPPKKNKLKREHLNPRNSKDYRFHIWVYSPSNRDWGVPVSYINGFFNKEKDALKYAKKTMKKYHINRAFKNHYPNWKTPLKEIYI